MKNEKKLTFYLLVEKNDLQKLKQKKRHLIKLV